MSILSFLKSEEETCLLVDIGNGSMACALVLFAKNKKPRFLYSIERPFIVTEKPDIRRLSDGMDTLLDSLLSTIIKKSKSLSYVVVSFSSPWFVLKTKNIHLENNIPFTITKFFINSIVSKEEKIFKKELLTEFSGSKDRRFSAIEQSLVHTTINGYAVEDVIGKKTKFLDASIFLSAIATNIKEKIVNIISKQTHIPEDKILLHSFPLVLFSAVRDNFTKSQDFILMDITSELTDMTLVSHGVISKNISFPFGRRSIVRQIAKTFNISPEIAESQLSMYISAKIDQTGLETMQKLMQDLEKEWSVYLEDTLQSLSENMILPKTIYITADNDTTPIFMDFLSGKNIEIVHINKEVLSPFYQTDSKIGENEFITILALFYDKLFKNQ